MNPAVLLLPESDAVHSYPVWTFMMADAPRLFLITPKLADAAAFAPHLAAALEAADVACLLLRANDRDDHTIKALVRDLAPMAQGRGAAVLVEQSARLAARLDVDGVQIEGTGEELDAALQTLRPHKIVGAGGLAGRDAAMSAGEAGVDYLMFGGPETSLTADAILEDVAWWAGIFNVPCVGYARHPGDAAGLAAAGAEFVALCEGLWDRPAEAPALLRAVQETLLSMPESVR